MPGQSQGGSRNDSGQQDQQTLVKPLRGGKCEEGKVVLLTLTPSMSCRHRKTNSNHSNHSNIAIIDHRSLLRRWQHTMSRELRPGRVWKNDYWP
jgi:hypothetical protein